VAVSLTEPSAEPTCTGRQLDTLQHAQLDIPRYEQRTHSVTRCLAKPACLASGPMHGPVSGQHNRGVRPYASQCSAPLWKHVLSISHTPCRCRAFTLISEKAVVTGPLTAAAGPILPGQMGCWGHFVPASSPLLLAPTDKQTQPEQALSRQNKSTASVSVTQSVNTHGSSPSLT
jgi:hypothetical protein